LRLTSFWFCFVDLTIALVAALEPFGGGIMRCSSVIRTFYITITEETKNDAKYIMNERKWRAIKAHITPKQATVHHMLRFGTRLLSLVSLLILRTTIQIHCDSLVHISCLLTSDIAFIIPRNSWT
jgi:hypothetical protein